MYWLSDPCVCKTPSASSQGQVSPLTEYFFWPRKDAWDELRIALEARPWVPERYGGVATAYGMRALAAGCGGGLVATPAY